VGTTILILFINNKSIILFIVFISFIILIFVEIKTKQMSDIEEVKKAQIFLLNTHIDDVVLNAKEYPENTKENAKEWIYLSSVLKAYSNQQQQTIDNLTKEVEELRAEKIEYKEEVFQMLMDEDLEMLAERL